MDVPMRRAKRTLAALWFLGATPVFLLCLVWSLWADDAESARALWTWLLPTVLPTLSLIVGVLVADSLGSAVETRRVDSFMFRLAFGLSSAYLALILVTLLARPFSGMLLPELLDLSQTWLAPVQGLAVAALGAFFVQREALGG